MRILPPIAITAALCAPALAQEPTIGTRVADPRFTDVRWMPRTLADFGERVGFVLFFTSVGCPIAERYLPRVESLAGEYRDRGVQFVAVNVGAGDSLADAAGQAVAFGVSIPFVKDFDGSVARAVGVDRTVAAVVLDAERRLHYRGRVDSQYHYGGARPTTGRRDLAEALDDLLAGTAARVAETPWEGCKITARPEPQRDTELTWARDVARIVQRHCQDCHRPAGEAPFALMTYDDVVDHAEMIAEVVDQQRMPPWYATSEFDGEFVNHRGLDADERRTLLAWLADLELPRGDPTDDPPPREFDAGPWRIGEPDLVLKVPTPVRLPADGYVDYRYYALPYRFEEDTWVEAVEIKPDNERVLHHANLAHLRFGERFDNKGFITGQVPGGDPMELDPGTAVRIPAGSVLGLQVHYVTTGKPEVDRLRVGLRFPRVRVQRELRVMIATSTRFEIPAGAEAHVVEATRRFPDDARALGLFAHMHLRGRDMSFTAELPDGSLDTLLVVPNYSFDWQHSYRWPREGRRFPAGTRIRVRGRFDNSRFNPFNPAPDEPVRFGQQTYHEMMYGFVFWTREGEALDFAVDPANGRRIG